MRAAVAAEGDDGAADRIERGSGAVWVGRAGKSYTVQKTEDFKSWNAVSGPITGQDTLLEYSELTTPARAQFYRLNIQ